MNEPGRAQLASRAVLGPGALLATRKEIMNVALPVVMFLVGFALGGGVLWLLSRKSIGDARQQERNIALADVRVAEERAAARDVTIAELRAAVLQKEHELDQRREEINQLKEDLVKFQTILAKEREAIDEKIKLLSEAEKQFKDAFKALATDALENNTKKFDDLYSKPVTATLDDIRTKIALVGSSATNLGAETAKLARALQRPDVRGQWGEMALERALELAGMSEGRDFDRQQTIHDGDARQRPDIVVHLPGNKHLAIDAKAPIDAFLEAARADDDETRQVKLGEFAGHVRKRVKELGGKTYHQNLPDSLEFVLLYLPNEAVYRTALDLDADLLEYTYGQRVFLVGPTNLMAVLLVVAESWKQEAVTKHAKDIYDLGKELYKRLATLGGHIGTLRSNLDGSVKAYNAFVGSLESMVLPQARKFEQYGAAPVDKQLEELPQIETVPRSLQRAEFALDDANGQVEQQQSLAKSG
jgi:DNA recombination protein RmuC